MSKGGGGCERRRHCAERTLECGGGGEAKIVDLKDRTRAFSLRVIRAYAALPKSTVAQVIGKQMLRSATSVGAHYREAVRSRSRTEFVSKLGGALQELEETSYWMELVVESGVLSGRRMRDLAREADELTAILTTCAKKTKARMQEEKDEG